MLRRVAWVSLLAFCLLVAAGPTRAAVQRLVPGQEACGHVGGLLRDSWKYFSFQSKAITRGGTETELSFHLSRTARGDDVVLYLHKDALPTAQSFDLKANTRDNTTATAGEGGSMLQVVEPTPATRKDQGQGQPGTTASLLLTVRTRSAAASAGVTTWYVGLYSANYVYASPYCLKLTEVLRLADEVEENGGGIQEVQVTTSRFSAMVSFLLRLVTRLLLPVVAICLLAHLHFKARQNNKLATSFLRVAIALFLCGVLILRWDLVWELTAWCVLLGGGYWLLMWQQFNFREVLSATPPSVRGLWSDSTATRTKTEETDGPTANKISDEETETAKIERNRVAGLLNVALKESGSPSGLKAEEEAQVECPFDWEIDYSELSLSERVGVGSFGEVYKGEWHGQCVAVKKVLFPMHILDEALIRDFRDEIVLMSKLRHPQVVLFMGACVQPPHLCIVTEWMPRGSLFHVLKEGYDGSLGYRYGWLPAKNEETPMLSPRERVKEGEEKSSGRYMTEEKDKEKEEGEENKEEKADNKKRKNGKTEENGNKPKTRQWLKKISIGRTSGQQVQQQQQTNAKQTQQHQVISLNNNHNNEPPLLNVRPRTPSHVKALIDHQNNPSSSATTPQTTSNKAFPFELVLKMALDAALGLGYLHSRDILHRDVKSLNLLVDMHYNVKICDFGLSKIKQKGSLAKTSCGTPNWMAPELLRGEPYTEKVDVYSFGMICWEMITQQVPFADFNTAEIRKQVGWNHKRPVIPLDCPKKFAALIKDCWHKNPKKRPSFQEIVKRLQTYHQASPRDSSDRLVDLFKGIVGGS
ncbi:hypothetical protein QOT17_008205 [Balamuthia mandrillaris]